MKLPETDERAAVLVGRILSTTGAMVQLDAIFAARQEAEKELLAYRDDCLREIVQRFDEEADNPWHGWEVASYLESLLAPTTEKADG